MKVTDDYNEYNNIIKYGINNFEYGINIPNDKFFSHGKIKLHNKMYSWLVMEEYCFDCSIKRNYLFDEKNFLHSVIKFLKYIHIDHKVVHSDIKLKNILYKNNQYRVCDFETLNPPTNKYLCDSSNPDNYYYYLYGCEYQKPVFSYRFDLQAVGYMLWSIHNDYKQFEFQNIAQKYYEKRYTIDLFDELEKMKKTCKIPEKIKKYFDIVSKVDWYSLEPPSGEIYDEILNL